MYVDLKNNNPSDNRPSNLRVDSVKTNLQKKEKRRSPRIGWDWLVVDAGPLAVRYGSIVFNGGQGIRARAVRD